MQAPQLRAGLDADLLHQHRARLAVGVKRLRLPAAAVQRQHPLRVQALPQRVLGHQRVELADDLAVPAGGQVTVDRQLERRDAKLVQTADLGRRERLVRHIRQRRAAPQAQRVARRARRDELLEAPRIQLAVAEPQLVTAPARDDLGAVATVGERLAQLRDVQLHHLGRRRRRLVTPEPPDEPIRRDRRARVQRQQRQQRPWLPRADEHRLAAGAGLHGSENADVHIAAQRSLHEATVLPLPRHYRASTADLPPACSLLAIDSTDHPEEVTMKSHRRRQPPHPRPDPRTRRLHRARRARSRRAGRRLPAALQRQDRRHARRLRAAGRPGAQGRRHAGRRPRRVARARVHRADHDPGRPPRAHDRTRRRRGPARRSLERGPAAGSRRLRLPAHREHQAQASGQAIDPIETPDAHPGANASLPD